MKWPSCFIFFFFTRSFFYESGGNKQIYCFFLFISLLSLCFVSVLFLFSFSFLHSFSIRVPKSIPSRIHWKCEHTKYQHITDHNTKNVHSQKEFEKKILSSLRPFLLHTCTSTPREKNMVVNRKLNIPL